MKIRLMCASIAAVAFVLSVTPARASAAVPPGDEQAVRDADRAFVAAMAKADAKSAGAALDAECAWTTSVGDTYDRAKLLASLPKPALGDETGVDATVHMYGQLGSVQVSKGKTHVLRVWGKRASGWRLLAYHEVIQRDAPPSGPPAATTNQCDNPCKGVPYKPRNTAEREILKSWGELETAVTNHDPKTWSQHFGDEFFLISSGGTEPVNKAGRMKALERPGVGPAPSQLAADPAARFIHVGDAAVMVSQANPYAGKPSHVSRIWVKREGKWVMALSYQTTVQSAQPIVPPAR